MTDLWAWGGLAGLGAFHGVNPAMGWLFAVALGLQRRNRAAVVWSLLPIAVGHALSIALVLGVFVFLRVLLDTKLLRIAAALLLFAVAAYRIARRHTGRIGMQVGFRDLLMWSFLMATAHGAGVMLIPVLLHLPLGASHASHLHSVWPEELASSHWPAESQSFSSTLSRCWRPLQSSRSPSTNGSGSHSFAEAGSTSTCYGRSP